MLETVMEVDPLGAQKEVLDVATDLQLDIVVTVAYEVSMENSGLPLSSQSAKSKGGKSTYLGAAPIVHCLERDNPHVVITSRVADAALFLAPMVYELGWNWNDFEQLAQGALAGHLLECGCQLTGGYFMHPGDCNRDLSFEELLDLSLPFAEVGYGGEVCVAKANGSGGILNGSTCSEQLLYEVGDPGSYITPDVVIDLRGVSFCPKSNDIVLCDGAKPSDAHLPEKLLQLVPMDCGWKGWGEISYGGYGCVRRAWAAEFLVRSWMDDIYPGVNDCVVSYVIGHDSLKAIGADRDASYTEHVMDVRLRMDGLFKLKEQAVCFVEEFTALYTNGPAGGGGICTGHKKEIFLHKELVERENIFWRAQMRKTDLTRLPNKRVVNDESDKPPGIVDRRKSLVNPEGDYTPVTKTSAIAAAAPSGKKIPLYKVAHSRAGDKGNDLNFSIIPHFPEDIERLKKIITSNWVKDVVSPLLEASSFPGPQAIKWTSDQLEKVSVEIYEAPGIHSLNVVVRNILDGGVNCSRRIDRHGKAVSDLILCQEVILPP